MYFCSQCWYTLCLYRERNTQFNWLCLLTCVSCKTCHCLLVVIYLAALHIGLPLNCSSCGLNAEPRLGCWRVWRFDGSHWNGPDRLCGPNRTHLPQTHRYLTLRLHSNYSEKQSCCQGFAFPMNPKTGGRFDLWPVAVTLVICETRGHMENLLHNHHPKLDSWPRETSRLVRFVEDSRGRSEG